MRVLFFSAKSYDKEAFLAVDPKAVRVEAEFMETHLSPKTAVLASGYDIICAFVNDDLGAETLQVLNDAGVRSIVLRCAGYNNVDLEAAKRLNIRILRVPAYSPHAVAEHALALIMTLNRKTHKAYTRVREGNFLLEGLVGKDVHGRTVGVIGTGKIGQIFASIMRGLGCTVLAYDPYPNEVILNMGGQYVSLDELYARSEIISLHCPLMKDTHHLINHESVQKFKPGVVLINTSRGGLIHTQAVIDGLKQGQIGALGLDVYEEEEALFFENLSEHVIADDVFTRLLTFPNVLITGHQAFLTQEALHNIATTTLQNIQDVGNHKPSQNEVRLDN
jgi:D-lactate dehydrogenase